MSDGRLTTTKLAGFDHSQALAADSVAPTLISANKYKVEGCHDAPMETQEFIQSRVDEH